MPALDKIYRKTLCLQDYHLSEGNCRGLAAACDRLDNQVVNKMLISNCGLNDATVSIILQGVQKIKDFKALTYCRQAMGSEAVSLLAPLIARPIPFNLEELVLVDTKMSATAVEQLADALIKNDSRIKKFTLVDVQHSDKSFRRLTDYVAAASSVLEELDVSWSMVRPQQMLTLLQVLESNRNLTSLSLAHNVLL